METDENPSITEESQNRTSALMEEEETEEDEDVFADEYDDSLDR